MIHLVFVFYSIRVEKYLQLSLYKWLKQGKVIAADCSLYEYVALFSLPTDLHAPFLRYRFFSSFWVFSWKEGRWFASPGCPQTYGSCLYPLVQSSRGPGPSGRWSVTFSFLCSRERKWYWSHRILNIHSIHGKNMHMSFEVPLISSFYNKDILNKVNFAFKVK